MKGTFRIEKIRYNNNGKRIATVLLSGENLIEFRKSAKAAGVTVEEYAKQIVKKSCMCFDIEI